MPGNEPCNDQTQLTNIKTQVEVTLSISQGRVSNSQRQVATNQGH